MFPTHLLHPWLAHPQALWLLALIPVLGLVTALSARRRRRVLARWGSRPTLESMTSVGRWRRRLRSAARGLGLMALILGVAGPQWGRDPEPATAAGRDLVVVLDLSRSMLAQDVLGQSSPNRLGRAKDAVLDLLRTVERRGGHRLALVVFAARAQQLCPLTHDYDHFRETLAAGDADDPLLEIGPGPDAASGTRIGAAVTLAVKAHDPRARGHQDILLISDGDDPAGDDEWRQGIRAAQKQGIPVHTVGIGDPDRASPIPLGAGGPLLFEGQPVQTRLQEKPLQEIARQTGGVYTAARTSALPLGDIFRERIEPRGGREDTEDVLPVYRQHSAWFFGAALLFLGVETVLGDRRRASMAKASRESTTNHRAEPSGRPVFPETSP